MEQYNLVLPGFKLLQTLIAIVVPFIQQRRSSIIIITQSTMIDIKIKSDLLKNVKIICNLLRQQKN